MQTNIRKASACGHANHGWLDSMGNGCQLKPGQIQLMSAGSGVTHSEFKPSRSEPAHLLQIWIKPRAQGLTPSYPEWPPPSASAAIQQDAEALLFDLA